MKRTRNNFAIGGVMALMLLGLSSCESDTRIEIKLGMWPAPQLTADINMFNIWKASFEEDYPQYQIVPDNYEYAPNTVVSKGQAQTLPTVFQTWFTEPEMLVNNRYIRDITPQLEELNWLSKMDTSMKNILTKDNKIYGVPRDGYGLGMVLNLKQLEYYEILTDYNDDGLIDIHDELGNPLYPTTFAELRTWCERINEASFGDVKGALILAANKTGGWQFSNFAWNFGAELQKINPTTNKWEGYLNSPEAVSALEFIRELALDGLLLNNTSAVYNDWTSFIGSQVCTAFVGNDIVANAVSQGGLELNDIAFVPMPAGPDSQNALFGGTPFVFAANATDEQVLGALRFLEYMGRSPSTSPVALKALEDGAKLSQLKGTPILPSIRPWINTDYNEAVDDIEAQYVNVNMDYYQDFYDTIYDIRHDEEPYFTQGMYSLLDNCLQAVLSQPGTANSYSLLTTANNDFNNQYMSNV